MSDREPQEQGQTPDEASGGGDENQKASVNILVLGTVQGVFFRASALERAQSLNLTGWVKNLADGRSVELCAEGPRYALESLIAWCHEGPAQAEVEHVTARWGKCRDEFKTFTVVR